MRRYKYLEKMHEEEMNKILVYLKGFSEPLHSRKAIKTDVINQNCVSTSYFTPYYFKTLDIQNSERAEI